jgi:hypothetical protein
VDTITLSIALGFFLGVPLAVRCTMELVEWLHPVDNKLDSPDS